MSDSADSGAQEKSPRERVGVFGGTFDPPHLGHLITAVHVHEALELDRLLLVVNHVPWQKVGKRAITPSADRLAMVEAAVADVDGVEASAIEIERGGETYSADTLEHLAAPNRDLFLVVGGDAAAGLDTWDRPQVIAELATIVVVARPSRPDDRPPEGWNFTLVDVPDVEVSSTEIRARLRGGKPVHFLTPVSVLDCIEARRLYRPPSGDR